MTISEMNLKLYEIRLDAIQQIFDLIGGEDYKFKYSTNVEIEDEDGGYFKTIVCAKVDEAYGLYFAEDEEDDYESGYTFGDMSTETIVNLLSHISFDKSIIE